MFLHGAGGHTGWTVFLEELAQRFAVFAPEHPGFGGSDDPTTRPGSMGLPTSPISLSLRCERSI